MKRIIKKNTKQSSPARGGFLKQIVVLGVFLIAGFTANAITTPVSRDEIKESEKPSAPILNFPNCSFHMLR